MRHRVNFCRIKKHVLQDLCRALVRDERVVMTFAKAKWIQKFGDRMITLGKEGGMANEQRLSNWLMDRQLTMKVIEQLSCRYKDRGDGYTRMFKIPNREKDQAKMAILEYVDNPFPPLPHPSVRKPPSKLPVPPSRFSIPDKVPPEGTPV